ncbi:sigma-54-dependent transcriptional regulator [Edaphobacter aggregans]|uniref:sigma-54-dependent transcriptional regulator n=1 Tax=Edaphobacter aggregans TaxID=570835 RepID=UPI0005556C8B|nr:sigma 54-interacting transcriptional regulator [Edaphobacter aggregans]
MSTSGQTLACLPSVCLEEPEHERAESAYAALLGSGATMRRLRLQIERIGPHFRTVLVRGEMGTGKELVARALHERSGRAGEAFVFCHAATLAEMAEDERGDWLRGNMGSADAGTLFVDGAEELSVGGQRGLLRMLEQKMGSRVIVSTAEDLRSMAAAGRFRQDLYHRLARVEIVVEPLRNRTEDIPDLAMHFMERFAAQYERSVEAIAPDTMERLRSHAWPGNVRDFENVLRNGVLQCQGTVLGANDLSSLVGFTMPSADSRPVHQETPARLQDVVEQHVVRALRECSGNKVRAAECWESAARRCTGYWMGAR